MPRELEPEFIGRTYDDFLIRPQRGVVGSRRGVRVAGRAARGIGLELPVVSANMDSVTEGEMAKALALEGGLGFVHRGLPIEAQAEQVARVKRSHGGRVEHPLSLPRTATLREAREFTRRHRITGILIEEREGEGELAGLLSNRDMPWVEGRDERRVDEFMTPFERLHTGPPDIRDEDAERIMVEHRIEKLPLVDGERRIRGLITKKDIILSRQRPDSTKDDRGRLRVGAAIGAHGDYLERAAALIGAGADVLLIDIAHGHSDVMRRAVESFRGRFPDHPLVAGNVGTGAGARFLLELGVDGIKVGIGPGRGCRTRLETAAGVPQLQAIREAWCAVEDAIPIIADGGIREDKDIFLAMVCGGAAVMLGSLLCGTDEAPGVVIEDPATHEKHKLYRGMTSPQAVFEALYDTASPEDVEAALDTPAEGQEIQVPYKGGVRDVLHRIRGHLRSAVSYAGGATLQEVRAAVLPDPMRFLIPLSDPARRESYER
jgi:IMP dehydrogenase